MVNEGRSCFYIFEERQRDMQRETDIETETQRDLECVSNAVFISKK